MSEKHTQGRLHVGEGNNGRRIIYDERGWAVADAKLFHASRQESEDIENARRLVACWNACEGITTERLEDLGRPLMKHLIGCDERAARMVQEREELLSQLRSARDLLSAVDTCSRNNLSNLASEEVQDIDKLIAKVNGGAA